MTVSSHFLSLKSGEEVMAGGQLASGGRHSTTTDSLASWQAHTSRLSELHKNAAIRYIATVDRHSRNRPWQKWHKMKLVKKDGRFYSCFTVATMSMELSHHDRITVWAFARACALGDHVQTIGQARIWVTALTKVADDGVKKNHSFGNIKKNTVMAYIVQPVCVRVHWSCMHTSLCMLHRDESEYDEGGEKTFQDNSQLFPLDQSAQHDTMLKILDTTVCWKYYLPILWGKKVLDPLHKHSAHTLCAHS